MATEDKVKPLSLEEVTAILSEIARNGEGAERFRALKMVAAQETGLVTLPEPISDREVVLRGARLMRAMGVHAVHLAYYEAFPGTQKGLGQTAPKVTDADLNDDGKPRPVNLKQLYRQYPEIKRSGVPQGYPMGGDLFAVKAWCIKKSVELDKGRLQRLLNSQAAEIRGDDEEVKD